MGHAHVLGLVDHREMERRVAAAPDGGGDLAEYLRQSDYTLCGKTGADLLEDRPQKGALGFGQTRLAAKAAHVAIRLPGVELPGIDHLLPLGQQEVRAELVARHFPGGGLQRCSDVLARSEPGRAEMRFEETQADGVDGVNLETFGQTRIMPRGQASAAPRVGLALVDQPTELRAQRVRQNLGERGEQNPRLGIGTGQEHRAMQSHHGLPGAGRTRNAGGPGVVAADRLALRRMQEDRPLLPGELERSLQLLDVRDGAEASLGVGMLESLWSDDLRGHGHLNRDAGASRRLPSHCETQQSLGRLAGKVVRKVKDAVLGGRPHVVEPFNGNAVFKKALGRDLGEEHRLGRSRPLLLHVDGDDDLLDGLADLHQLGSAGLRMRLQPAPLGPLIGPVVVIDVAEQQAAVGPMDDEPDVAAHPHRPEVPVPRPVELVKLKPRTRRIDLKIERRRLRSLLLVGGEAAEAVGERVGDSEVHKRSRNSSWQGQHRQRCHPS